MHSAFQLSFVPTHSVDKVPNSRVPSSVQFVLWVIWLEERGFISVEPLISSFYFLLPFQLYVSKEYCSFSLWLNLS